MVSFKTAAKASLLSGFLVGLVAYLVIGMHQSQIVGAMELGFFTLAIAYVGMNWGTK